MKKLAKRKTLMRTIISIIALVAFAAPVFCQNIKQDTATIFMANVFKQDGSYMDTGVLWAAQDDEMLLLPKSQFRKWEALKIRKEELDFIKIPAENLKCLKIYAPEKRQKSALIGLGIGVAVGIPIGIARHAAYDKEYCEGGDDPLWTQCIGGSNRFMNNVIIFGTLGGLSGIIRGAFTVNINLKKGTGDYQDQKGRIKKYSIF